MSVVDIDDFDEKKGETARERKRGKGEQKKARLLKM